MNTGDVISRYRIIGPIGKGGMGVVYRADDTRLQRQVALKFLPREGITEEGKSRFLNEARAAAKASHPNICPIFDIEEADGELFIAMACLEGETLSRKIARGSLPVETAIDIAAQVASGLASAHDLGIIHRDIKSGNIMVDASGHASIMDFGLALAPGADRLTQAGGWLGTPAYMSPEQARGEALDARTDLWSLGVVMFEMLTGVLPFRRDHKASVIHAILDDPVPDISKLRPGVPAGLQRIVEKALSKDPAARWPRASTLAPALKRLQTGAAIAIGEDSVTQTMAMAVEPPPKRGKRILVAATAAGLLLTAAAGVGVYRYSRGGDPNEAAVVLPAIKQVAVIPFQIIGTAEATRNISDGLVEIIASALSDVERLQKSMVAVPTAELRRRGINSVQEARRVYGVNLAIMGSAQPAGDKIQFTVNLLDAITARQIASRIFLFDPNNPLVSRDQAIAMVVRLMQLEVSPAAQGAITAGDTAAPNAYSAYIQGRGLMARYDIPGNVDQAIAAFTKAAGQDPKYALAYAGLGEAYLQKARDTSEKRFATLANQNAEYAVQLDGRLALVHSVLGRVQSDAGRQKDAIQEFQRAMELAPANAEAPRELADVYKKLGRFDEAEALYMRSIKAKPTDWFARLMLAIFYYERERYAEAVAELNQAKEMTPDNDTIRRNLGAMYKQQGRYKEAAAEFQQALRIRSNARTYAALADAYFSEHRFQEAASAAEAAIELDSADYRYWGNLGAYYKWAPGNEAKSAPALRKAIELAAKYAETTKSDYAVHANLAEYRARLGDSRGALAEIDRIPPAARAPFTARLAIVYELTGHRDKAVAVIRSNLRSPASLTQIRIDPDLAAVWRDSKFQ